jgi:peptidyl-prolyl cis-trans isomerase A (cyclophilin A)
MKKAILPISLFTILLLSAQCKYLPWGKSTNDTIYLESGVKYLYMKKGEGTAVTQGALVSTHINLTVGDKVVWSTYNPPGQPLDFQAGVTPLIQGFLEVVLLAKTGDRILAVIPPHLGYGERGAGTDIPPNATLLFDIEVLSVTP